MNLYTQQQTEKMMATVTFHTLGLWGRGQSAFLGYFKVFYPNVQSYQAFRIKSLYRCHQNERKK